MLVIGNTYNFNGFDWTLLNISSISSSKPDANRKIYPTQYTFKRDYMINVIYHDNPILVKLIRDNKISILVQE